MTTKEKFEFIRNLYLTLTVLNIRNKYAFNVPSGFKNSSNLNTFVEMYDNSYITDGNSKKHDILYIINTLLNGNLVENTSKKYYQKYREIIKSDIKNGNVKKTLASS